MSLWSKKSGEFHQTIFKSWGDKRDVTSALQNAIQQAKAEDKVLRISYGDLGGDYLISEPIISDGVSIICDDPFNITFFANPETSNVNWVVGANENDVGLFASLDKDNVTFSGLGIDGQDAYVAGMTFMSGNNVKAINNYIRNTANCGIQFYGANGTKYNNGNLIRPVTNGQMYGNTVKRARWTLVFDGEVHDSSIVNNVSVEATNRHISVDPHEASPYVCHGLVIANNNVKDYYTAPASWSSHPSSLTQGNAIAVKDVTSAVIEGNFVRDWKGTGIGAYGLTGSVVGNVIQEVSSQGTGILVDFGKNGLVVNGNSIIKKYTGVRINSNTTEKVFVTGNNIVDAGTAINNLSTSTIKSNNLENGVLV